MKRNVHKGALELFGGFGKNAIFEEKETNYDKQEKKILQVNQEIKNLLLELEKRQDNEDEA